MENLADCSATWLGIPRQYAFLLVGWLAGLLIGFLVGKARGDASGSALETLAAQRKPEAPATAGVNLVINGKVVDIPSAALGEIHGLLREKNKIEAIKRLREATGLGLAEAKAAIDSLEKVAC